MSNSVHSNSADHCWCHSAKTKRLTNSSMLRQGTRRTYWCAYGPDDQRNKPQPEEPPDATDAKPRKRRGSFKRGCQARFDVTRYLKQPDRVRIWLQSRSSTDHVDAQGQPCHGPACEDSGRYAAAPVLSSRIRSAFGICSVKNCVRCAEHAEQRLRHAEHAVSPIV